jgi:hypothetical protein
MDYQRKTNFMPGYTGYVPQSEQTEMQNKIQHVKHIPGYGGYIPNIKAENKFSESYGKLTAQSIMHSIPKGMDLPPYSRYTSSMRESFVNQRNVKIMSTAELLGVSIRKDTYKKPIPIDTINKFWGIDTNKYGNDEVVETQAFEQSLKNFWSFMDGNKLDFADRKQSEISASINSFWGVNKNVQELYPGKFNFAFFYFLFIFINLNF